MPDCPFREKPVVKYVGRFIPQIVVGCPMCGRTEDPDPSHAGEISEALRQLKRPDLKVAVMHCIVNGLGECGDADIGVLYGKGKAAIYRRGALVATVKSEDVVRKFTEVVESTW